MSLIKWAVVKNEKTSIVASKPEMRGSLTKRSFNWWQIARRVTCSRALPRELPERLGPSFSQCKHMHPFQQMPAWVVIAGGEGPGESQRASEFPETAMENARKAHKLALYHGRESVNLTPRTSTRRSWLWIGSLDCSCHHITSTLRYSLSASR
jgi:hypothetical protein